ncbi:MAG: hypothetical protein NTW32_10470 [Chloroflexi bacterium]|nr:hypothetical protein [Chloroflexota bacterium]
MCETETREQDKKALEAKALEWPDAPARVSVDGLCGVLLSE